MVIGLLTLLFIAFCFQFCSRDTDRHNEKNPQTLICRHQLTSYFAVFFLSKRANAFCVKTHQNLQYGSPSNLINCFQP